MWNKLVFGGVAMLLLTGCGQVVDETKKPAEVISKDIQDIIGGNVNVVGGLPDRVNPDAAEFQTRLVTDLEEGVLAKVFEGTAQPISRSISFTGGIKPRFPAGPELVDGKYKMYLVKTPVSRLSKSPSLSCTGKGNLYRATIAAKPYLKRVPARTNADTENVRPYEVHVCDGDDGIIYALLAQKG